MNNGFVVACVHALSNAFHDTQRTRGRGVRHFALMTLYALLNSDWTSEIVWLGSGLVNCSWRRATTNAMLQHGSAQQTGAYCWRHAWSYGTCITALVHGFVTVQHAYGGGGKPPHHISGGPSGEHVDDVDAATGQVNWSYRCGGGSPLPHHCTSSLDGHVLGTLNGYCGGDGKQRGLNGYCGGGGHVGVPHESQACQPVRRRYVT